MSYGDFTATFAEQGSPLSVLAGGYSSRPNLKKLVKDTSAVNFAAQRLFAFGALKLNSTDPLFEEALTSQKDWMDLQGVAASSNVIRGTLKERVAAEFAQDLHRVTETTKSIYGRALANRLQEQEGIGTQGGLQWCSGSQNDTGFDCPISKSGNVSEFLVVVHNPRPHNHTQFVRIKLPSSSYRVQMWSKSERDFVDLNDFDILEQLHFKNSKKGQNETFSDYEMFINQVIAPDSVEIFKILATD